ncbi:hypothetical protein [Dissulfuribacter thermophilus]|uniref:hypothetical protein n=1 Tax=Dissulfuribacter thermophilus TaxID=1156395 RepID=UPI000837156F|nr:hypothetical protein [Dissulfuribacter thermophilus]
MKTITFISLVCLVFLTSCASKHPRGPSYESLAQDWGIQVQGIYLSSAGYMLDFRYKVIDPKKAKYLLKKGAKVYVIHEATGRRVFVPNPPKVGPLRSTTENPIAGRTYFVLFANPGRFIAAGQKVTVVMGDLKLEHLKVR